jgi:anthranilate/para-aminobenzoate synthase component II
MAMPNSGDARFAAEGRQTGDSLKLSGVDVVREGRVEPFLHTQPTLSSAAVGWSGLALEDYSVPALVIPQHRASEDSIVEALERPDKRFVLGVQWHPEDQMNQHPEQLKLFQSFADALQY